MELDCRPEQGMTNQEWARNLLEKMGYIREHGTPDALEEFLAAALTYACVYSERPSDRFAKEHLVPGHKIESHKDVNRPGWIWVRCEECNQGLDVDGRDAVLFCVALDVALYDPETIPITPEENNEEPPASTD